jgi:hypothetical protein
VQGQSYFFLWIRPRVTETESVSILVALRSHRCEFIEIYPVLEVILFGEVFRELNIENFVFFEGAKHIIINEETFRNDLIECDCTVVAGQY